jgi:hypothetical protein
VDELVLNVPPACGRHPLTILTGSKLWRNACAYGVWGLGLRPALLLLGTRAGVCPSARRRSQGTEAVAQTTHRSGASICDGTTHPQGGRTRALCGTRPSVASRIGASLPPLRGLCFRDPLCNSLDDLGEAGRLVRSCPLKALQQPRAVRARRAPLVLTERLAGTAGDARHRWDSGRGVPYGDRRASQA